MATSTSRTIESSDCSEKLVQLPIGRINVAQAELFQAGNASRYFERLRKEAPVHYCADSMFGPYWSITKHEDIEAVELDTATYSSELANGGVTIASHPDEPEFLPAFISMDPPRHTQQRRVIAPAFSPERMDALAGPIRAWSIEILEGLPIGEPFDWVDRVSIELTARTLALLLGFPQERSRDLIRWSEAMVAMVGTEAFPTIADKLRVMKECFDAFDDIWEERRRSPGDADLISMLATQPATRNMPRSELHGNILLLIVGGNDTTRNSITGSVVAFDRFPAELKKLRNDLALIGNLTPEILRWQTPALHMRRTATCDTVLKGQRIAKGDKVVLWYLSGNRDEDVFERADQFMIDRPNARRHLALGVGIHRCVGARLADLQIRTLWEEILKRFPRIEVLQEPERTRSTFIHGYPALKVSIAERYRDRS